MPTPVDAPYKRTQRECEAALRQPVRHLDRTQLYRAASVALGLARNGDADAVRQLHTLRAMMTRRERAAFTQLEGFDLR